MNDCEKIGCNLCNSEQENPTDQWCPGKSHSEVTDIRNRELGLFFLAVLILIIIGIAGGAVYDKYLKPAEREYPVVVNQNAGD
jgi:hypothetical protein